MATFLMLQTSSIKSHVVFIALTLSFVLLQQPSYDWTVFSPAPQDRVRFSLSELEQELEHSTKQGVREPHTD